MKRIIAITLLILVPIMPFVNGCLTLEPKIHVIQNTTVVTNNVPVKAFNDEEYVWENFIFTTNEVKKIDQ